MTENTASLIGADPLAFLLGEAAAASFLASRYEREPVIGNNGDSGRFRRIVNIDDIDRLVTSTDLREGDLLLADASRGGIESETYIDDEGYVDRGVVATQYRSGATIIINQGQRSLPGLGALCEGLEHVFSAHIQTNLYLTPPDSQGFPSHYDNHCVFVIQVEGRKRWRLYGTPVATPYRGEGFDSHTHERGEVTHDFVLGPGDCAYIPRGLMHDAETTGNEPSLHVAIGLITRTWADLMLEAVSEVALRQPAFRNSLPAGYARQDFDRTAARATMAELGAILARDVQVDPALDLLANTFIKTRPARNRGRINDGLTGPAGDARYQRAPYVAWRMQGVGDYIVLMVPGGELHFAAAAQPALNRALDGTPFTHGDLPGDEAAGVFADLLDYGVIIPA
jgi:bifunctional lysine-specific demethylase and histidyl-hydroxylase NO66